jgi:uncharacterized protein (UPF0248 family)
MKSKDDILLEEAYSKILMSESNPDAMNLNVAQHLFQNPEYLYFYRLLTNLYRQFKRSTNESDRIKIDYSIKEIQNKMREIEIEDMKEYEVSDEDESRFKKTGKFFEQTEKPFSFDYEYDKIPNNIGYSNRTFNVRGKDVLVKIEWDTEPDTGWYNFITLVDPVTKERVFKDIPEEEIKKLWKTS